MGEKGEQVPELPVNKPRMYRDNKGNEYLMDIAILIGESPVWLSHESTVVVTHDDGFTEFDHISTETDDGRILNLFGRPDIEKRLVYNNFPHLFRPYPYEVIIKQYFKYLNYVMKVLEQEIATELDGQ